MQIKDRGHTLAIDFETAFSIVHSKSVTLILLNSYNGLGAFYLQVSKKELADTNLELARTILLDVTKKEPENGRAFYLLAVTSFYQNKFEEAKQESDQAQSKHFKVPEDFLKDLSLKSPGSPAIDKR
jgi:hypothetical protein